MSICYPAGTDWSNVYTEDQLTQMRQDAAVAKRMELAEARAWYTLASLTAYRIGVCPELVRPVAACSWPFGTWMAAPVGGADSTHGALPLRTIGALGVTPYVTGGQWVNGCGCAGIAGCGHDHARQVVLEGPVGAIERVEIDGEIIAADRYRVDNGNVLVALGDLRWPLQQDVYAQPGQPGTFSVTYYRGQAPDELTRAAAGALAVEFYRLATADRNCRFPRKVKQVARFGVTYEVDTTLFENGVTNIPEADFLINLLNPNRLKQAPRVVVPRTRPTRRPTYGAW